MDIYNGRNRKSCALQTSVLAHTLSQLSCIVAIIGAFLLVDFPERAHRSWKFLTEAECAFIIRRETRIEVMLRQRNSVWASFFDQLWT